MCIVLPRSVFHAIHGRSRLFFFLATNPNEHVRLESMSFGLPMCRYVCNENKTTKTTPEMIPLIVQIPEQHRREKNNPISDFPPKQEKTHT